MAIQNKILSFWKQVKLKSSDMFTQFRVGVGVKVPTHKLHVKDSTDPVKIEGLQNDATDPDKFLTIDSSDVVKYRTGAQVLTDIGGTPLTTEQVQDLVGAMFSSNTETRVTATYQDADGTIDLVVDDMTADTNTNLGNTNLTQDNNRTLTGNGNDLIFTGQGLIETNSELHIKNGTEAPDIQIYEASGSGTNYVKLTVGALAAHRTLTIPDATGTIALTSDIPTGNSIIDWTGASAGTIHSSNYTNTNIANTDLTITGSRTLNMDGDDLTFSGVAAFTVQGESIFEGRITITNGSSAPELKLKEPSGGGSSSGILTVGALSADKTYTFPDATGTVALTSSNITGTAAGLSSTLSVASGGTGRSAFADKAVMITQDSGTDTLAAVTMFNNGELLIGGTDGPAAATLTQGNGLTITNANGGITIAVDGDIDTTGESGTVDNIGNLTGDVTSSNRATTIANDAVTYAKMQNVSATNVVLGRDSAGAGVVEEISAANLRTIINVEDGATADQTKGDIDALGIAATTAVSLTAGDKIIDGNLGLGGDDNDAHYVTRLAHSDDEGGRLYVQGGTGGGTNKAGGSLLLQGGASTGNVDGGSIIFGSSAAGSSGSSVNSVGLLGSINSSGNLSIEGDLTVKGNDIKDDDGTTCITFDSSGNTTVSNTLNATLTGNVTGNASGSSGSCTGNAATATALTSGDKTIEGNLRLGGTGDTSNNWLSIDAQNGDDSSGGGITFYETGTYDVDSPQYGAKIVYNEDADEFAIGTMHNNVFMRQIYFSRQFARTYFNGDLQIRDSSPSITVVDTSTTVANGDVVGTISFNNEDDDGTTLRLQAVATEDHASGANGGTKLEIKTTPNGSSTEEVALTVGEDKSLTVGGAIELGHATDTTLARSAAGIATIEGKQIFTTNTPALTSAAAGVPAVTMQIRRTITTAEANALNSTPIELIPAQGANTVIVLAGGMIRIDRAATQTNSAADMNLHYEGLEPGTFAQTALFHARRFMYNETGDRVYNIIPGMSAYEVAQSLTQDVNKAVEVSVDSALTSDCITSMEFYLTYNVFNIS